MLEVALVDLEGDLAAHNGKTATLFDYDDASRLYGAELSESGDAIPVPAASVLLPDEAVATVVGLQGAPQYNGSLARVLSHDVLSGRYAVQLDADEHGGKQLKLRRGNLQA